VYPIDNSPVDEELVRSIQVRSSSQVCPIRWVLTTLFTYWISF
jgi:hypothetical protein